MAKKSGAISTTVRMKTTPTKMAGKSGGDDSPIVSWETTTSDPLLEIAREIVDQVWPDTATPDIVNGVWDETPIMKAVLVALQRGREMQVNAA